MSYCWKSHAAAQLYLASCILFIFDDLFSFGDSLLTPGQGTAGGIMPI